MCYLGLTLVLSGLKVKYKRQLETSNRPVSSTYHVAYLSISPHLFLVGSLNDDAVRELWVLTRTLCTLFQILASGLQRCLENLNPDRPS